MTCPLCSTGITPLRHYYEAVRPSPAHRYFRPRGWSHLRLTAETRRTRLRNRIREVSCRIRKAFTPRQVARETARTEDAAMTTAVATDLIALRDGTYVLRRNVPADLLRRYDEVGEHKALLEIVALIRKAIDPSAIIRKVGSDELRKDGAATFSQAGSAESGVTNYSIEGDERWEKHFLHVGKGEYVPAHVVNDALRSAYDKTRGAYHAVRGRIRASYASDVVGGLQETYLQEEVQRAATAAEARHRYTPGGPEHLSDAHSAISRVSHVEIDFSILMENIRVSYARALVSGEHENSAFQAEMDRQVLSYIAQMAAPTR